ncbi:hypothetical protein NHX12_028876 [Muraenolepis orangiensis]|uniref:Uncharacterized protein n=1 Tax=Muraenolepis orangiensis TaxID=630683 RepID=A0A9Q0IMY0_9TELE|nr:hypothetical protein NHX12_028876 [Muraenolepis orangiensis]
MNYTKTSEASPPVLLTHTSTPLTSRSPGQQVTWPAGHLASPLSLTMETAGHSVESELSNQDPEMDT